MSSMPRVVVQTMSDWPLTIIVAALYPLFAIKTAQVIFPCPDDGTEDNQDSLTTKQYIITLVFAVLGLAASYLLAYNGPSSLDATNGLLIGSALLTVWTVWTNYNRLPDAWQMVIVAILVFSCLLMGKIRGLASPNTPALASALN